MKRGREEEEFDENDIYKFVDACSDGDVKHVQDFIRRGIDVNVKSIWKRTALHFAGWSGCVDVVKMLIQNGADVNAVDDVNQTQLRVNVLMSCRRKC